MNILVIIHSPFLDRIPSLKTLLFYLMDQGHKITLITSKSSKFDLLTSSHENLTIKHVNQRSKKLEFPTMIKEIAKVSCEVLMHKYDCVIGGDAHGNILARYVSLFCNIPHIFFALEFPQIKDDGHPVLSKIELNENKALVGADYIITHDKWHGDFIKQNFNVLENRLLYLANASFTPPYISKTDYLNTKFEISSNKVILLHSGGFLKAFRCDYLAKESDRWADEKVLIFHTSHKVETDDFFKEINSTPHPNIRYSLNALDNQMLDKMISSAQIGLALYSVEVLGYRAELMGLAGGKIGNYLKCGVPVIATRLPSLSYLEDYGCGILIENETQISEATDRIMREHQKYSENAYKCYMELWHPGNYLPAIEDAIINGITH